MSTNATQEGMDKDDDYSRSRYQDATIAKIRLAPELIEKIYSWVKREKDFLIYCGNPGIGKTYFCKAIENYIKSGIIRKNIRTIRYWREVDLFKRIRSSMHEQGDFSEHLKYLIDDDLILFDDLGSTGVNDWRKEVLFDFVDQRYEFRKPTVITSNLSRQQICEKLGDRFHSRIFSIENTILEVDGTDWRANKYEE